MSQIQCPDCAKKISDKAPACPRCGRPLSEEDKSKAGNVSAGILTGGSIMIAAIFILTLGLFGEYSSVIGQTMFVGGLLYALVSRLLLRD